MSWRSLVMRMARRYPRRPGREPLLRYALRGDVEGVRLYRNKAGQLQLLSLDNWIDRVTYVKGTWERVLCEAFAARVRDLGCEAFLDIGAAAGCYTLSMARLPSVTEMYAFEPDPRNYAQLCANLWLNDLAERVSHHPVALSSANGESPIYLARKRDPRDNFCYNTGTTGLDFEPLRHDASTTRTVTTRRLDDLIELSAENIAVKMDTEGHELEVLKGMRGVLKGRRGVILVEVFPHNLDGVRSLLSDCGFEYKSTPVDWNHIFLRE